jgi:hypothetical protein
VSEIRCSGAGSGLGGCFLEVNGLQALQDQLVIGRLRFFGGRDGGEGTERRPIGAPQRGGGGATTHGATTHADCTSSARRRRQRPARMRPGAFVLLPERALCGAPFVSFRSYFDILFDENRSLITGF